MIQGSGLTCLQSNTGEHLSNESMFATACRRFHEFVPPPDLKNPPALRRMTSPRGLLAVSQAHFQSAVSSWALQPAVQERDSAKSTEDKRIHSTHSSGTSSFAHRKYQPARFVWTDNKYYHYIIIIISSINTAPDIQVIKAWLFICVKLNKTVTNAQPED